MKRSLRRDCFGISVMYDAVFFAVLVSLSGAILLPAMHQDIAIESQVATHREKVVDEALLAIMNSRADENEYRFAGSQIEDFFAGIGQDSLLDDDQIIGTLVTSMLGKEQLHKTYADLLAENLASQLQVFTFRMNMFTDEYDQYLKQGITSVLNSTLGERYQYNLTATWHPIEGVPFGGEFYVGQHPPQKDTHVAQAYITMPESFLTQWLGTAEEFIQEAVLDNLSSCTGGEDEVHALLWDVMNQTIYGILFDGFSYLGLQQGLINTTVDVVFGKIQTSLGNVSSLSFDRLFDDVLGKIDLGSGMLGTMLSDFLDEIITNIINEVISTVIAELSLPGFTGFDDLNGDSEIDMTDILLTLKLYVVQWIREFISPLLDTYILQFVDFVMGYFSIVSDFIDTAVEQTQMFFRDHINVLRGRMTLTVWEVRG